jgi:hypothetical protein
VKTYRAPDGTNLIPAQEADERARRAAIEGYHPHGSWSQCGDECVPGHDDAQETISKLRDEVALLEARIGALTREKTRWELLQADEERGVSFPVESVPQGGLNTWDF